MPTLNSFLWALGLVLQALLLAALVRRGVARRLPSFALLIAFYLLRSVFLFFSYSHLGASAYAMSYTRLSVADLLLQLAVAWQLFTQCVSLADEGSGRTPALRKAAAAAVLVLVVAGLTWAVAGLIPSNPRNPVDRGVLFPSGLMLLICLVSVLRPAHAPAPVLRILAGFAALGAAGILSQVGRALASLHRQRAAFLFWSYGEAVAYLLVLLFWLVVVSRRALPQSSLRVRGNPLSSSHPS